MEVLEQLNMSLRDFAGLCGGAANGAAPSTVRRVLIGQASEPVRRKVAPLVGAAIRRRLAEIGSDPTPLLKQFLPEETHMEKRTILTRVQCQHFGFTRDPFSEPPQSREEAARARANCGSVWCRIPRKAPGRSFWSGRNTATCAA